MNIVIIGSPGSGKGTQAKLMVEKYDLYYFETGSFSRELTKKDPRIKKIVDSGELIPETEMTEYVSDYLDKNVKDFNNLLIEGYPRFATQYKFLEKWMDERSAKIDWVIFLEVDTKEVVKRLSARRVCSECDEKYNLVTKPPEGDKCKCGAELVQREDDKPEAIKKRLEVFKENTLPMVEYIETLGKLIRVDGERPIEVIHQDIVERIEK